MLYLSYISAVFLYYLFEVLRQIQKAVIKPVVRGPTNLSEIFSDFWNVYKENGLGRLMTFKEIKKKKKI